MYRIKRYKQFAQDTVDNLFNVQKKYIQENALKQENIYKIQEIYTSCDKNI